VVVTWTLPGAGTVTQTQITDAQGIASFAVDGGSGFYSITVNGIVKLGAEYDAINSQQLTATFTK
jgi:hypothetical protein